MPLPLLSLAALSIGADAPKRRKAGRGVGGLAIDSSSSVRLVVLSRVTGARDLPILEPMAATAVGQALIIGLQGIVLRAALRAGLASPQMDASNVLTLFNLSGSHVHSQRLYDGGLSLPSRLPHAAARKLLAALLDALAAARSTAGGASVAQMLLLVPAPAYDAQAASALAAMLTDVEADLLARLGGGGDGGDGGGDSDAAPAVASVAAVEVLEAVAPSSTLLQNVRRLLEASLTRPLTPAEAAEMAEALEEAATLLGSGSPSPLLASLMGTALLLRSGSMLWAVVVEATSRSPGSLAAFRSAVVGLAGEVSGAVMLSSLTL
jgi:hypothetical protein